MPHRSAVIGIFYFWYEPGFPQREDHVPAYRVFPMGEGDTVMRTCQGFSISTSDDEMLQKERIAACFGYIATTYEPDVLRGLQLQRVLHAGGTPYEEPSEQQQEEARVGLEAVLHER